MVSIQLSILHRFRNIVVHELDKLVNAILLIVLDALLLHQALNDLHELWLLGVWVILGLASSSRGWVTLLVDHSAVLHSSSVVHQIRRVHCHSLLLMQT